MGEMQWESMLPPHLQLPLTGARELEAFRTSIACPEDAFAMRIVGSGWATRRTQKKSYDQARHENPGATEAEFVKMVYNMRKLSAELSGQEMPALPPESRKTLDVLVDYIVEMEARQALPDPYGWGKRIDEILAKAG